MLTNIKNRVPLPSVGEEVSKSKNGIGVSSNGVPIPPSSFTAVVSPSIRAVLLAQALALPDWVDHTIRQDEIDDGGIVFRVLESRRIYEKQTCPTDR